MKTAIVICGDEVMKTRSIKELANQIRGVSYKPEDLHDGLDDSSVVLLRANNIADGEINFDDVVYVDKKRVSKEQMLQQGDVLICASSGSKTLVGKAATIGFNGEVTFGAFCKAVRPCNAEDRDYVSWFFQSPFYRREISDVAIGANINNIRNEHIDALMVNWPSKDARQEAVNALLKNDLIIRRRKEELNKLDDLIKARFVEMFGTYPANEKGWGTGTIRDLVTEVRYGSSRKAAEGCAGKYPYLRMNNITYGGELDLTDIKTIDIPDEELDKCSVRYGDLLFNRTNSKELVGKTCVYNRNELMVLAGFVVRVRLNEKALPEFVSAFMNTAFSKRMLLNMSKAAIGQANINAQELQSIGIYIPPVERQREFVYFKTQVDKSRVVEDKHKCNHCCCAA